MNTGLFSIRACRRVRRGFSLVEAAIVLGVVGVVIGGIWTAASTVNENLRVSRAVEEMVTIVPSARQLFADMPDVQNDETEVDSAQTVLLAGVAPSDMVGPGVSRTFAGFHTTDYLISPWGEPVSFYQLGLPANYSGGSNPAMNAYTYSLWNLPTSVCHKLISAISGRFRDNSDLLGIYTRGGSVYTHIWTIPVAPGAAPCTSDDASGRMTIITFFFRRTA